MKHLIKIISLKFNFYHQTLSFSVYARETEISTEPVLRALAWKRRRAMCAVLKILL